MSDDARIGRVLVASLHQAIADVLPDRLEFYENWLTVPGLREGTIGLAPLSAVLSFLRLEGEAYNRTTARAGEYAADWTVSSMSALERRVICALPTYVRARAALPNGAGARALHLSRIARQGQACGAARRRSTCAARSSARRGRRPRCRCAGSTRRRSRACSSHFALEAERRGARVPRGHAAARAAG